MAVGCGSGDSTTTEFGDADGSEPLTKAEFIERADAICLRAAHEFAPTKERYDRLKRQADSAKDRRKLLQAALAGARELNRSTEEVVAGVRELEPPAEDAEAINEWLSNVASTLAVARKAIRAREGGERDRYRTLDRRASSGSREAQAFTQS